MIIDCVRMIFTYYNDFLDREYKVVLSHAFKSFDDAAEWIKNTSARQAEARKIELRDDPRGVPDNLNMFFLEDFTEEIMLLT